MKFTVIFIILLIILAGCDSNQLFSLSTADISTWPKVLDNGIGYSYQGAHPICVNFGRYKDRHVIMTNSSNHKTAITNLYHVNPSETGEIRPAEAQLKLLEDKGFLESTNIDIDGVPTLAYGLTVKGWALGYNTSNGSLCIDSGRTTVKKILDYQLLPDQGSGLTAYNVKYEIGVELRDWINNEVISTFDYKIKLPKPAEAVLVKGPKGYFYPSTYLVKQHTRSRLPTAEEAMKIIKRDKFIKRLCEHKSCSQTVENAFKIYYVGMPKGNMIQFRFSFPVSNNDVTMGKGYLEVDDQGNWSVDKSGFSTTISIEEARLIRSGQNTTESG